MFRTAPQPDTRDMSPLKNPVLYAFVMLAAALIVLAAGQTPT
jgi:hypothetical protein